MNLLIVTQKVDKEDENLGFFHRWIEEFARHSNRVLVIAGSVGRHSLPGNVEIYSLGKENGERLGRAPVALGRAFRVWKFWELFSHHYARADAVFFHMAPEFVLAASPFLISLHRSSALWYTHKSVTRVLKLAEKLVDYIFTASELSFRLPSKKVIFTGHAIDIDSFKPSENKNARGAIKLLALGRISPVKDYETIIRACSMLKNSWDKSWVLSVVGGPLMPRDEDYFSSLKKLVREMGLEDRILFYGARPYTEIAEIYDDHDLFISMSSTGSIDKSVLEAMASGLTVLTANEAFQSLLPPQYFLEKRSPEFLAERIKALAFEPRPNFILRELVAKRHSLNGTVKKITEILSVPI